MLLSRPAPIPRHSLRGSCLRSLGRLHIKNATGSRIHKSAPVQKFISVPTNPHPDTLTAPQIPLALHADPNFQKLMRNVLAHFLVGAWR